MWTIKKRIFRLSAIYFVFLSEYKHRLQDQTLVRSLNILYVQEVFNHFFTVTYYMKWVKTSWAYCSGKQIKKSTNQIIIFYKSLTCMSKKSWHILYNKYKTINYINWSWHIGHTFILRSESRISWVWSSLPSSNSSSGSTEYLIKTTFTLYFFSSKNRST